MVDSVPLLRVIRRLRELLWQWWELELVFADRDGRLHGLDASFSMPPVCQAVHAAPGGVRRCIVEERKLAVLAAGAPPGEVQQARCFAGMLRMVVPIHLGGSYAGAVLVGGYRKALPTLEERAALVGQLSKMGISPSALSGAWERLRLLDERDERYLAKLLGVVIEEVASYEHELAVRSRALRSASALEREVFPGVIGQSAPLRAVLALVAVVAQSDAGVLVTGESGTGKELIARCLHARSGRGDKPFIALNCGAFQDQLLESELFGHIRGSFTGAVKDKDGLLVKADGGTLFLDEVGEMSLAMQVKLLRVLQEGTFYPVGATAPRRVNVRIVAATHRNLESMTAAGSFREDLYYRLNVIRIAIPALRERPEDIPPLVDYFLSRKAAGAGKTKRLHPATLKRICAYSWPGNVRELENEIERIVTLSGSEEVILPAMLSEHVGAPVRGRTTGQGEMALSEAMSKLERDLIEAGLRRTRWNKSRLARELAISRTSLLQKIEKYGLERRRTPRKAA